MTISDLSQSTIILNFQQNLTSYLCDEEQRELLNIAAQNPDNLKTHLRQYLSHWVKNVTPKSFQGKECSKVSLILTTYQQLSRLEPASKPCSWLGALLCYGRNDNYYSFYRSEILDLIQIMLETPQLHQGVHQKNTPFQWCIYYRDLTVFNELLSHGVSPLVKKTSLTHSPFYDAIILALDQHNKDEADILVYMADLLYSAQPISKTKTLTLITDSELDDLHLKFNQSGVRLNQDTFVKIQSLVNKIEQQKLQVSIIKTSTVQSKSKMRF